MNNLKIIRAFIDNNCILSGKFAQSSGGASNIYFDLKRALLDAQCSSALIKYMATYIKPDFRFIDAIGGYGMGGALMVSHFLFSGLFDEPLKGMVIRDPKKHGTKEKIENRQPRGSSVLILDDVLTTGASMKKAHQVFVDAGYNVVGCVTLLDISEKNLRRELKRQLKVPVISILKEEDLMASRHVIEKQLKLEDKE